MFRKREDTVSEDDCSHKNTVEAEHEGDVVCTDCGLVVEPCFSFHASQKYFQDETDYYNVKNFILDVCANAHIPKNICEYSYSYFKKSRRNFSPRKVSNNQLAAFSIYEALQLFEVPRTVEEIQFFTGENVKKFALIESVNTLTNNRNDPTIFVDRFCNLLELEYFDSNLIKSIVCNMYGMGNVKSNCLIATCIHLYCKEKKRKILLKTICQICEVSATSVHRIVRQLDKKYVQQITLLCSK
jgi:transcription initiation factor TFIIIB Brf1 subunit/transcription initiation factor TFIIB